MRDMNLTKKKRTNELEPAVVAVRLDSETLAILDELCADAERAARTAGDAFGGRSQVIRKALRYVHAARPWRTPTSTT